MTPASVPLATYRLQLSRDFTMDDAASVAGYLGSLHISHLYLSPVLSAAAGSNHGYDVTDFSCVSAERGGLQALRRLSAEAERHSLRMLLDIVPNHMAAIPENPFWHDVLAKGRDSVFWTLFDLRPGADGKIHLPVLGSSLEEALREGSVKLFTDMKNGPFIGFGGHAFPLNEASRQELAAGAGLETILGQQFYTFTPWTEAMESMSYRRFFHVTGLAGVRVEQEENYRLSHAMIFNLLTDDPVIAGVRVDHIDGLSAPGGYLRRLAENVNPVWIEKILARDEDLPGDWPVSGTTGYDFIDRINCLFIHPCGFTRICEQWRIKTGTVWNDFQDCVADSKTEILQGLFRPELERIADLSASSGNERAQALLFWTGVSVGLDVYRIYAESGLPGPEDRSRIAHAAARARQIFGDAYQEAEHTFLPALLSPRTARECQAVCEWQQLSGPVMAKGLEDTAHYRFTPLVAMNEVGCAVRNPADDGREFFTWLQDRARKWPLTMNATSTHDTKRAEDVRHRVYALADCPGEWFTFLNKAARATARFKTRHQGRIVPGPATEDFLYQALLGTWPFADNLDQVYCGRILNYMAKACREARQETEWTRPDTVYEKKIANFIRAILGDEEFLTLAQTSFRPFAFRGAINSLSVQTLKILSPGVPDIYQGTEGWDFSLVDPDNRRPVDFTRHRALLAETQDFEKSRGRRALLQDLTGNWQNGAIKLWLTRLLLEARRDHILSRCPPPFHVMAVAAENAAAENIVAWRLTGGDGQGGLIAACPRYPGLIWPVAAGPLRGGNWSDTRLVLSDDLKDCAFYNLVAGCAVSFGEIGEAGALFAEFPVAVMSFQR